MPRDPEPDAVDRILAEWARERPDLDVSPMGVIGRISRLAVAFDGQLRPTFAARGLGEGEFDVLATLRRAGRPFERTPGELAARMMVTSGAVSKRVDRLESRGLVARSVDEQDGRVRRVGLTAAGASIVDEALGAHVATEHGLLSSLTVGEQVQLAGLLRRLCVDLEPPFEGPGDERS